MNETFASFLPLILIFVVFYFLLIRPQQKKMKDHKEMISKIKRGDNILTAGGVYCKVSRVIDERYPDYRTVLPKDNNKTLTVNREEMLASLKRVSIFSNRSTRQIELEVSKEGAVVRTEDPENASRAEEKIKVDYDGEDISVGFNANYFVDMLSHLDGEKAVARMNTPTSATLLGAEKQRENEEITMLLMPMRTGGQ